MAKRIFLVVAVMAAGSLFAQQVRSSYGAGWGSAVFQGGVRPLTFPSNTDFAHRLGGIVAGVPYTGAPSGGFGAGGLRGNRFVYVPMPVYVGGYYGYAPAVDAPPSVTVVMQQPGGQQPPVVINQNFAPETPRPVMQEYAPAPGDDGSNGAANFGMRSYEAPMPVSIPDPRIESSPAARPAGATAPAQSSADVAEQKATIYLIAFRDQTIQAAYAYWVDGNTLHYVTVQGGHNRATLDLIDREMSDRLNRERSVDFSLARAR